MVCETESRAFRDILYPLSYQGLSWQEENNTALRPLRWPSYFTGLHIELSVTGSSPTELEVLGTKGTCPLRADPTPTLLGQNLYPWDPGNSAKIDLSLHPGFACLFLGLVSAGQIIPPVCMPIGLDGS